MNKCKLPKIHNWYYETERFTGSHRHEVFFGGADRQKSIATGLYVFLRGEQHNLSKKGVHYDKRFNEWLRQEAQKSFEREYSREEFLSIFHKNYL